MLTTRACLCHRRGADTRVCRVDTRVDALPPTQESY